MVVTARSDSPPDYYHPRHGRRQQYHQQQLAVLPQDEREFNRLPLYEELQVLCQMADKTFIESQLPTHQLV